MSRAARQTAAIAVLGAVAILLAAADGSAQSVHGLPREGRGSDIKPNTRVGRPAVGKEEYTALLHRLPRRSRRWPGREAPVDRPEAARLHRRRSSADRRRAARFRPTRTSSTRFVVAFVTTNMPSWRPAARAEAADLLSYIKTFSPRWKTEKPGKPVQIPAETPVTTESILAGAQCFRRSSAGSAMGTRAMATGRRLPRSPTARTSRSVRTISPPATRFKCGTTNADLYRVFMTGLDGTPMPSFADNLKPIRHGTSCTSCAHCSRCDTPEVDAVEDSRLARASHRTQADRARMAARDRWLNLSHRRRYSNGMQTAVRVSPVWAARVPSRHGRRGTDAPAAGGTIAGKVTYTGTPPKMKPIDMAKEPTVPRKQHSTPVMTENVVTAPAIRSATWSCTSPPATRAPRPRQRRRSTTSKAANTSRMSLAMKPGRSSRS